MSEFKHEMVNNGRGSLIPVPAFVNQAQLDMLSERFAAHDDDLFLVAYPQSGLVQMQQLIYFLFAQAGGAGLDSEVPQLEAMPGRHEDVGTVWEQMPRPRCFASHLPIQLLPGVHSSRARYLYVARNPKDAAAAIYHHEYSRQDYHGDWAEFFELFFQGQVKYGPYFDHVLEWWQASQHMKHVEFVTYEEMQTDPASVVGRAARFLGLEAGEELVQQVAAGGRTGEPWGQVGDWRKRFTVAQNIRFEAQITARTLGTGLVFDFGDE
jgi:hypothetical protein